MTASIVGMTHAEILFDSPSPGLKEQRRLQILGATRGRLREKQGERQAPGKLARAKLS
jgi:hypothetical protein